MSSIIFHIDVNSAYLSWEACYRLQQGDTLDLRDVPSIVGGNEKDRHGIVLAKSIPAKKFKIQTGESVREAFTKCPHLISVSPHYHLYMKCSDAMLDMLKEYSPRIQRYSVDECFLDYSNLEEHFGDPLTAAHHISALIKKELGFTVNVGISSNKLLAKMASDFKKPDRVHTLFPHEISTKMWPLPVRDLFMVGSRTAPKLHRLGIFTIGQLALADPHLLQTALKSHGKMIWDYANGIEASTVRKSNYEFIKGMGNSTTISFDVEETHIAHRVLLSLMETTATRLRKADFLAGLVSVSIKTKEFKSASHQKKLSLPTDSTTLLHQVATELFDTLWDGTPIRKLGIRLSSLVTNDFFQTTLLENPLEEKLKALDGALDDIRLKHGSRAVHRACFLESGIAPLTGGVHDEYPMMGSLL